MKSNNKKDISFINLESNKVDVANLKKIYHFLKILKLKPL